jgi:hypothetical protein
MMHDLRVTMLDDKPESIFIREPFASPPGVTVGTSAGEHDGWLEVSQKVQIGLDLKIREAGWHFIWLTGAISRRGFGWSFAAARLHSIRRSLGWSNLSTTLRRLIRPMITGHLAFTSLGSHCTRARSRLVLNSILKGDHNSLDLKAAVSRLAKQLTDVVSIRD